MQKVNVGPTSPSPLFSWASQMCFEHQLTRNIGKLILQGADISHIYVEEGAELGHSHTDPGDRDVCQATAAVHWEGSGE